MHDQRPLQTLNIALIGGLGSGFGYIFERAVSEIVHADRNEIMHFVVLAAMLVVLALTVIHPLAERLDSLFLHRGHADNEPSARLWALRLLILIAIEVVALVFHHELGARPDRAASNLGAAILISGSITFAWITGLARPTPRPALYGFLTGAVVGTLYVAFVLTLNYGGAMRLTSILSISVGNGLTLWGLVGLVGGWSLTRWSSVPPSLRILLVVLPALVLANMLWALGTKDWIIQSWKGDVALLLGWCLLLFLQRGFDAAVVRLCDRQ